MSHAGPSPNFFIIGAAKAGTSALYTYLVQHPDVFMSPVKEPHYFSFDEENAYSSGPGDRSRIKDAIGTADAYERLFRGSDCYKARGEASTTYLDSATAAYRLHEYSPRATIIVILRNPAERAYASYMHLRRDGSENIADFSAALAEERRRIDMKWGSLWHYTQRQFSYDKLRRFYDCFSRTQICVLLYDDWLADNASVLRQIWERLDVNPAVKPLAVVRENVGGLPRSETVHRLVMQENAVKRLARHLAPRPIRRSIRDACQRLALSANMARPSMPPPIRQQLTELFRDDVLRVQDLVGRDLSNWLRR